MSVPAFTGEHRAPPAFTTPAASTGNSEKGGDQPDDFFEDVDLSQEWKNNASGGFYDNSHPVAFAPNAAPQHSQYPTHQQQPPQQATVHRAAPHTTAGVPPRGNSGQRSESSNMSIPAPIQTGPPASMWGGAAPSAHTPGSHMSSSPSPQTQAHAANSSSSSHNQGNQGSTGSAANTSIPPSTSTGSFFGFGGSASSSNSSPVPAAASASAHTPKAAPTASASASTASARTDEDESKGGIFGAVRKGMLKYLYPDAHDASSNIGKSLEAVYNKETGRWEFPGEVSSAKHHKYICTYIFARFAHCYPALSFFCTGGWF
jgi:hypothetical protein